MQFVPAIHSNRLGGIRRGLRGGPAVENDEKRLLDHTTTLCIHFLTPPTPPSSIIFHSTLYCSPPTARETTQYALNAIQPHPVAL